MKTSNTKLRKILNLLSAVGILLQSYCLVLLYLIYADTSRVNENVWYIVSWPYVAAVQLIIGLTILPQAVGIGLVYWTNYKTFFLSWLLLLVFLVQHFIMSEFCFKLEKDNPLLDKPYVFAIVEFSLVLLSFFAWRWYQRKLSK